MTYSLLQKSKKLEKESFSIQEDYDDPFDEMYDDIFFKSYLYNEIDQNYE